MPRAEVPISILDFAVHVPRYRLSAAVMSDLGWTPPPGVRSVAVCDPDEDPLTLAIEALRAIWIDRPISLGLASTTLPYTRKVQIGLLTEWLDQRVQFVSEHTTSARAGTEALALHATRVAAELGPAVVVASEAPTPDDRMIGAAPRGAATGVLMLGKGPGLATLDAWGHAATEHPGLDARLRGRAATVDIGVPDYETQAIGGLIRSAVSDALAAARVTVDGIHSAVIALPSRRLAGRIAQDLGITPDRWSSVWPYEETGDTGCAGALVGLAGALEAVRVGDRLLVVAYGGGGAADALVLTAGEDSRRGARSNGPRPALLDLATAVRLLGKQ